MPATGLTINPLGRDLLIVRVTGVPDNGLEQAIEFTYRILPGGRGFERLSSPDVTAAARVVGDELVVGLANHGRRTVSIERVGVSSTRAASGFTSWRGVNARVAAARMTADAPLPVTLEPGAPAAELRASFSSQGHAVPGSSEVGLVGRDERRHALGEDAGGCHFGPAGRSSPRRGRRQRRRLERGRE
jgi:hypothetical protein